MGGNLLKYSKFSIRAFLSICMMGIGAGIFFSTEDSTLKIVGSNMVTASWAAWMSSGSSRLASSVANKEECVGTNTNSPQPQVEEEE